ncbi:uncharacterized protein LOC128862288 [Anastrepha ludens]|uniref:uncharacterized protein LOC128862288 n=1 Tax=Anastrepha ludens TaxID=28586 RepID=UPI0023B0E04C|nr:uncharacterized protein LOC128862288 [Anastrepha ludens]
MPKASKCRVRECYSVQNVRSFAFPKNRELLNLWKENLRISPSMQMPMHNSFVCIKHFEEDAVGPKYLKNGAVPTLNLGYDDVPPNKWTEKKKKRSCCIVSCVPKDKVILFAFPRDEETRKNWALACNVQVSSTDRVFLCQRHFEPTLVAKYKLLKGAFPCFNLEPVNRSRSPSAGSDWVCPPVTATYSKVVKEVEEDLTLEEFEKYSIIEENRQASYSNQICVDLETTTTRERFAQSARYYQSNAVKLNKRIEELEKENNDLKNKYSELLKRAIIAEESCSSDALTFAKMIVSTKKGWYNEDEKALAQNLNYMSTKAYSFMRDDLGFCLPHKSSLLRWRPIRYVVPGFDANVVNNLSKIASKMSGTERICILLFDEMSIKPDLTYNKSRDIIDGFVDHGEGQRQSRIGNKCSVFMVKGLCSKWKYVFSYYISKNGFNGTELHQIVMSNISAITKIGLNIKVMICDQGPANITLFNQLKISEINTFFMHENNKIFCMFDYCHLIKSIRNVFMKYDIPTAHGTASFKVIRKLFDIDQKNSNFKICPKLTEAHIYPSIFEKMSVSRATQVLSNSVASGIDMMCSQNLFGNDENLINFAKPTQIFVKEMNAKLKDY